MASIAVDLSQTLVSHFAVIYGIALFFPSLVVLLAGGFLTLDRTRSFDSPDHDDYEKQGPLYEAFTPNKKKSFSLWQFHGGVGGMLTGFVFGLHFTSLVALIIANRTSIAPLSSFAFLAIWIVLGLLLGISGARWSTVALILLATLGCASVTLFLATAFHPSLTSRLVLLCLFIVISLCGTFIPILKDRNLRRWTVRASGACSGSLGITVAISVFSKVYGWESAWLRFVVKDGGEAWLTSKEKGLAFVFILFALIGTASDWILERRYGADPAPKWDAYLAHVPPWSTPAEGFFQPPQSFWQRLLHRQQTKRSPLTRDPRFPGGLDSLEASPIKEHSDSSGETYGETYGEKPYSNPYAYPIPLQQSSQRPLSLPPRISTAYGPQFPSPQTRAEQIHYSNLKPLTLPPRVTEVYSGAEEYASAPQNLPPPKRPSLQPFNGSSTSLALSGATAVDIGLGDAQSRPINHKHASTSDVDVVDVTEQGEVHPHLPAPSMQETEKALHAPSPPHPRPTRSFASGASPSRSREVLPIPEEESEDTKIHSSVTSPPSNTGPTEATTSNGGPVQGALPEYPYPQTPSLIKAVDRIRRAHMDAAPTNSRGQENRAASQVPDPSSVGTIGPGGNGSPIVGGASSPLFEEGEWDAFWGHVRSKAAVGRLSV